MAATGEKPTISNDHLENMSGLESTVAHIDSPIERSRSSVDDALYYLRQHADVIGEQYIDLKQLRRKIDWRILPIMYFLMGLQYLDKHLLKYEIIMKMPEDLGLEQGNTLNNVASSIYWAYLAMSPVADLALSKAPIAKWLGASMTIWGVVNICMAAVQNYPQTMVIRLLMGVFDASIPPALMLLSTQYYRKDEQAIRYAIWFSSIDMGDFIGGLISFGFQDVHSTPLESWRIMYLVLGLISTVAGILSLIFMPDTPMNARFLTDAEKIAVLRHVAANKTGISNHRWEKNQIKEFFSDPQIHLLALNVSIVSCRSGITTTYGAKLIKSFGFTSKEAALLNMLTGAVGIFAVLFGAYCVRKHWLQRWTVSVIGYTLAFVGAAMLAWSPSSNQGAKLSGIYISASRLPPSQSSISGWLPTCQDTPNEACRRQCLAGHSHWARSWPLMPFSKRMHPSIIQARRYS